MSLDGLKATEIHTFASHPDGVPMATEVKRQGQCGHLKQRARALIYHQYLIPF